MSSNPAAGLSSILALTTATCGQLSTANCRTLSRSTQVATLNSGCLCRALARSSQPIKVASAKRTRQEPRGMTSLADTDDPISEEGVISDYTEGMDVTRAMLNLTQAGFHFGNRH